MKQIIFTKEQLKKLNEEISNSYVKMQYNDPNLAHQENAIKALSQEKDKIPVTLTNTAKPQGVSTEMTIDPNKTPQENLNAAKEAIQDGDKSSVTLVPQENIQESFKKSEIEKKRLDEIRKHGVIMTKNELNKLLSQ